MLAIQFKMTRKSIENQIQIELSDDTDTDFALTAHSTASAAIGSIKRLHGDLLLKVSNVIQTGGARRIGQAVGPAASRRKPYRILRRTSRRDAEHKSGHRSISAAYGRTRPQGNHRSKQHRRIR